MADGLGVKETRHSEQRTTACRTPGRTTRASARPRRGYASAGSGDAGLCVALGWITIPPLVCSHERRRVDHDPAARWISFRPPLKIEAREQLGVGDGVGRTHV